MPTSKAMQKIPTSQAEIWHIFTQKMIIIVLINFLIILRAAWLLHPANYFSSKFYYCIFHQLPTTPSSPTMSLQINDDNNKPASASLTLLKDKGGLLTTKKKKTMLTTQENPETITITQVQGTLLSSGITKEGTFEVSPPVVVSPKKMILLE